VLDIAFEGGADVAPAWYRLYLYVNTKGGGTTVGGAHYDYEDEMFDDHGGDYGRGDDY
jgi:hypothetical protein